MRRVMFVALLLAGCGSNPLDERWSMSWAGVCDGEMADGVFRCGELAGTYAREDGAIDFGVATARVTESPSGMNGTVSYQGNESCFSAVRH